jgi:adenosylcobyric acid synthase
MAAKSIFIGGTGSHAGKSWVTTALCRYLYRKGYNVAPFKAQNMSNNSAVCTSGGEIGRAQAAQAEACGLDPSTDMNPILLKPTGKLGSQVVVNGKVWRTLSAPDYYAQFDFLLENVLAAYRRLSAKHDFIVIEGAGSISELNLRQHDLVNLGLATRIQSPCLLVADIDRGGVFAAVAGTLQLLEPDEKNLVRSFLVNRFRGDMSLFKDGVSILERKAGKPCLGVFPFLDGVDLDPEDSVSLEERKVPATGGRRVAIVKLPHISNFTDFRLLPNATYITSPSVGSFDTVILPGTKSTIEDLLWLRSKGMDLWLLDHVKSGGQVIGICGGYQMLGKSIVDPDGVESTHAETQGLGLLPCESRLLQEKVTRKVIARTPSGIPFEAYEIHMGVTTAEEGTIPFATLDDGTVDGVRKGRIVGTYLHGALENPTLIEELIQGNAVSGKIASKESTYDRMAAWFTDHMNPKLLKSEYGLD